MQDTILDHPRDNQNSPEPELYSKRAIIGFSVLMTVLVGAILLASNIQDRKAKWTVLAAGFGYTAIAFMISNKYDLNSNFTLPINFAGAYFMTTFFWDKYLGKDFRFKPKPIWTPLIVCAIIVLAIVFVLFFI